MNARYFITLFTHARFVTLGVVVAIVSFLIIPQITHAQSIIMTGVEHILWTVVNVLFGWLVWFGGMLLNLSINEFVIGFGDMYTNEGLGATVDRLWVVVRDIFNLTFIFGLVFIGLRMIFDSSNSSTHRMIRNLILAALLVNFSLFITKFVIDFSNIAAAQIATAFQVGTGEINVSGRFMNLMGLTSVWDVVAGQNFSNMQGGTGLGYILGTMILYCVSAFVFMAGGLLLMIRFAVLNIYMVLSPLMFLGWVFPSMAKISSEYWSGFMSKAFFAPAYLLMLYFAQSVLSTFSASASGSGGLGSMFGNAAPASFAQVVPPFILSSVFLIASLVIAQKMGANGASGVMSAGKMLTGKAKKAMADKTIGTVTRGVAAGLNSNIVTRANARLNNRIDNSSRLTRAGVAVANVATLGVFSRRNRNAAIQGSNNLSLAGSQSRAARQKEDKDIRLTDSKVLAAAANEQNFQQHLGVLTNNNSALAATTQAITDLGRVIREMSNDERANLDIAELSNPHVAAHLTDSHITSLESSGNFSPSQINTIRANRATAQNNLAQHGFATVVGGVPTNLSLANPPAAPAAGRAPSQAYVQYQADLQNHNVATIEQTLLRGGVEAAGNLAPGIFAIERMYDSITPAMLERRIRNGNVTNAQMTAIRAAIENYLRNANTPQRVVSSWATWSTGNPVGIRLGLNIPNVNPNPANPNPAGAGAGANNVPPPAGFNVGPGGLFVPNNFGGGARPRP